MTSAAGRAAAGAGPGRSPQPAVWRGAAVLHQDQNADEQPCMFASRCKVQQSKNQYTSGDSRV